MNKRLEVIDALRGFSLLGIIIANMLYFQYSSTTKDMIDLNTWWDQGAYYFTKIFVEGSFYPIFGFLFGYGLILFVQALENRNVSVKGPLWRRAIGLVVLGAVHIALVWDGDILLMYGAALMFIILFFLKRRVKTWIIWAISLSLLAIPFLFVKTIFVELLHEETAKAIEVLKNGSYLDIVKNRIGFPTDEFELIFWLIGLLIAFVFIPILGFFAVGTFVLFGMAAAKVELLQNVELKKQLLKKCTLLVPVGLLLKASILWDYKAALLMSGLGAYLLAIGYIALFILLFVNVQDSKLMNSFASVGRLSLSNYLLQSIICTTIFYGYGLGLFGKLGVALGVVLAAVIYAVQIFISSVYHKRFKLGPAEWVLRKFVYLGK